MAKVKIYSNRFNKEYEVEAVEKEGLQIVKYQSCLDILNEWGDAVSLETHYYPPTHDSVYVMQGIITDDAGVHMEVWASRNLDRESEEITLKFPVDTLYACLVSKAVKLYGGFPSSMYSDMEIPIAAPKYEAKPVKISETNEAEETNPKPKPYVPTKAKTSDDLGEYVLPFGNAYTKGKKLKELNETSLNWYATIEPRGAEAAEAKEKAIAYIAYKEANG